MLNSKVAAGGGVGADFLDYETMLKASAQKLHVINSLKDDQILLNQFTRN